MSAKHPHPCKHSGTSWGLESAEFLPAGSLEVGGIKGMRNERGGWGAAPLALQKGVLQGTALAAKGISGPGRVGNQEGKNGFPLAPALHPTPITQGYSLHYFPFPKRSSLSPAMALCPVPQTNYTQAFERFAAGCFSGLSWIRHRRHSILNHPGDSNTETQATGPNQSLEGKGNWGWEAGDGNKSSHWGPGR